jgi:hypothetical protein
MRRRDFITLLGSGAATWPLVAHAQQADKLATIGYLGDDASSWSPWTARFVERLRELGWNEGQNIAIEYRWSEGHGERIAEIATEFVRRNVNVIVTYGAAVAGPKASDGGNPYCFCNRCRSSWQWHRREPFTPRAATLRGYPSSRAILLAKGWSFCVRSFPDFADWRSCLMRGTPPPCGKIMRLTPQLASSALMSSHTLFDERRILHRPSKPLNPKPMLSTLQSMPSLMQTVSKLRDQRLAHGCRRHSMKAVVWKLVGLCRRDQIFQISSGALPKSSTRYFAGPNLVIFLLSSRPNSNSPLI